MTPEDMVVFEFHGDKIRKGDIMERKKESGGHRKQLGINKDGQQRWKIAEKLIKGISKEKTDRTKD